MWEISFQNQLSSFLYAVIVGIIFCIIYDILRAFRFTFEFSAISVFLIDIFYSLLISVISFLIFLSLSNGEIRSYIIFAFFVGFLFSRFTISKPMFFVFKKILGFFNSFSKILCVKINALCEVFAVFFQKILYFLKNSKNISKKT